MRLTNFDVSAEFLDDGVFPSGRAMSRAVSWSVRDNDFGLREAAAEAARRAGLSLHDWLDEAFRLYSAEIGVRAESLREDERAHAVAKRLGRIGRSEDRHHPASYDDGFWSRTAQAVNDLDTERFGGRALRQREPEASLRRRDREDAASRDATLRRRAPAPRRPTDAYDDIAEASGPAEPPPRPAKTTRRASNPDQTAVKRELAKFASMLAEVHETMTARGASSIEIEALRDEVADITRGIARLAPREAIAELEHAIQDLSDRLADARGEGLIDRFIGPVEAMVGDLKRTLLDAAPTSALELIDERLGSIARAVQSLSEARLDHRTLAAILEQTAEIRSVLESAAQSSGHLALIEQSVHEFGERLSLIAQRGQDAAGLEAVCQAIEHIRADIARNHPGQAFSALDERLDELSKRVDETVSEREISRQFERMDERLDAMHRDLAERVPELGRIEATLSAVEAHLDSRLRTDLDTSRLGSAMEALAERLEQGIDVPEVRAAIEDLSHRLEQAVAESADPQVLAAMRTQLARLTTHLEAPARADDSAARLERMMEALAERLDGPISRRAAEQVQETVRLLAERFERAVREGASSASLAGLDHRLAELTERLETRPTFDPARIELMVEAIHERLAYSGSAADASMMERSLQDINAQIAELREAAHTSAEIAARKAAQEALAQVASATSQPRNEGLEQEIADLRELQQSADKRTSETLSAVHDALEKVADRLSLLESSGAVRRSAPPEPKPEQRAPDRSAEGGLAGYRPSVELNFGSSETTPPPVAPEPAPAPRAMAPAGSTAQRISVGDDNDFLLEPGAGKPSARQAASARLTADDPPAASAQANFIAAVRRAQQAGGAKLEDAQHGASSSKAAPDDASEAAGEAASPLRRVRQSLLMGVAVVAFIVVGWQFIRPFIPGPGASPQPPQRTSSVVAPERPSTPVDAPAQAADKTTDKTALRASEPIAAPSEPPAVEPARAPARLVEAKPPVDMTPVSSLPPATSNPPAATRDPVALASAGVAGAQFELGSRLADGRNGPRDFAKAADWFQKAASQNFAPAQYRLGVLFEKGSGVQRDLERARALYQAAAERGNIKAMHNLGSLLAEGVRGQPDYVNAARWFKLAAEHGVRDSQYNIAVLLARGLGIQQNLVQSHAWFAAAAAQGDADSVAKLKEVAARLDARQLAQARSIHQAFRPRPAERASNDTQEPEGGWATSQKPTTAPGPTASQRPQRISGM